MKASDGRLAGPGDAAFRSICNGKHGRRLD